MSDDREERGSGFPWLIMIMAMLALYPLASGPIVLVIVASGISLEGPVVHCVNTFYAPLEWVAVQTDTMGFFTAYVEWWESLAP